MEKQIYLSAFIAIMIFCVCHKWTNLFQKICMFCTVGWVSIAMAMIGFIAGFSIESFDTTILLADLSDMFKTIFFLWAVTSVFYFYLKHLYE